MAAADRFWIGNAIYFAGILARLAAPSPRSRPITGRSRSGKAHARHQLDPDRCRFANGEMTQADLADRVGVTRQTIIAIEQGKYSPTLEMAFQIARVFRALDDVFQYPDEQE